MLKTAELSGKDDAYLAQTLLEKGYMVYGTYRHMSSVNCVLSAWCGGPRCMGWWDVTGGCAS